MEGGEGNWTVVQTCAADCSLCAVYCSWMQSGCSLEPGSPPPRPAAAAPTQTSTPPLPPSGSTPSTAIETPRMLILSVNLLIIYILLFSLFWHIYCILPVLVDRHKGTIDWGDSWRMQKYSTYGLADQTTLTFPTLPPLHHTCTLTWNSPNCICACSLQISKFIPKFYIYLSTRTAIWLVWFPVCLNSMLKITFSDNFWYLWSRSRDRKQSTMSMITYRTDWSEVVFTLKTTHTIVVQCRFKPENSIICPFKYNINISLAYHGVVPKSNPWGPFV